MTDELAESPKIPGKRRREEPSQLVDLLFHVADLLGFSSDREIAELAGVSAENVANWRSGAVQEFKPSKLKAIKASLTAQLVALKEQAGAVSREAGFELCPMEIEQGSSPTDLQRQFRDQVSYDYLGHRFLYYEPMGALAWESLIRRGYDQDRWVSSVDACAASWLDPRRESDGRIKGAIADALGLGKRNPRAGLDLISLGPGEGGKEMAILARLVEVLGKVEQRLGWMAFVPVDVSVSLLLSATTESRRLLTEAAARGARSNYQVKAFCADFEEGKLHFIDRLPTSMQPEQPGLRLVLMLGNIFGNLRDEEVFVQQRLKRLVRPGDLAWIEVGLRLDPIDNDPLFRMTQPQREETANEANRRLLLEGPYRRWEAATGRAPAALDVRVWLREDDDSSRIPGSVNFCHDLVLKDERRVCTMLYSRRYELDRLTQWFEGLGFEVLRLHRADDSRDRVRVGHLLLRRR